MLVENQVELMDLTAAHWRLTVEFGKLIFSAWNSGRSFSRRVEEMAYRDRDRFGIFVRKPGGRETTTLEFRELRAPAGVGRAAGRTGFRQQFTACWSANTAAGNSNALATVLTASILFPPGTPGEWPDKAAPRGLSWD